MKSNFLEVVAMQKVKTTSSTNCPNLISYNILVSFLLYMYPLKCVFIFIFFVIVHAFDIDDHGRAENMKHM